jgi:phage gp46-like protein
MTSRKGDLYLYDTENGGEISIRNGEPVMDGGMESAVYLSLFGSDNSEHWMNEYLIGSEKVEGRFFSFIKGTGKTADTMKRAQKIAEMDLLWFVKDGIADEVTVDLSSINTIHILLTVNIMKDKNTLHNSKYELNWISEATNPARGRI